MVVAPWLRLGRNFADGVLAVYVETLLGAVIAALGLSGAEDTVKPALLCARLS